MNETHLNYFVDAHISTTLFLQKTHWRSFGFQLDVQEIALAKEQIKFIVETKSYDFFFFRASPPFSVMTLYPLRIYRVHYENT